MGRGGVMSETTKKQIVFLAVGDNCWGRAHDAERATKEAKKLGRAFKPTKGQKGGWSVYAIENADIDDVYLDEYGMLYRPRNSIITYVSGPDPLGKKAKS
jgi:hypothetical protein